MRGAEWVDGEQVACLYALEALGFEPPAQPGDAEDEGAGDGTVQHGNNQFSQGERAERRNP